jgi:hypothetical protein
MTSLPAPAATGPAYMAQKSVTSFSEQGQEPQLHADPSWTAVPGAAAQPLLKSSRSVVQPVTTKDAIAAKNEELLKVAARETQCLPNSQVVCAILTLQNDVPAHEAYKRMHAYC